MHTITRVRHEPRRRKLVVRSIEPVTARMLRIVFTGDDLVDFTSLGPDDHVKLFFPVPGADPAMRDFTPRAFDRAERTLAIDFALHDAGPASDWARSARPGDMLTIGGPRGSLVVPADFDWWLLVGDETALPAMGRRVAELPAGTPVTTLASVADRHEQQDFVGDCRLQSLWVHRPLDAADDPAPLLSVLRSLPWPDGDGFVWIAAEAKVARAVREHVLADRGHPPAWLKASGYWIRGVADGRENFD